MPIRKRSGGWSPCSREARHDLASVRREDPCGAGRHRHEEGPRWLGDESVVKNKAVYLALALDCEGHKHVLGIWIEQSEGAKFWLRVMNELKTRGVDDLMFAVADGLKGFPDAITAVFPRAIVQTCIVHLIRHSLSFVSWQDRKRLMPALRAIYRAETADMAEQRLGEFEGEWGKKYPAIGPAWRRAWNEVVPFFAYPPQIRKMIYG
jgi:putative transposase